MIRDFDVLVIGGGASGFFAAINIAQRDPKLKIAILERGKNVLEKVRISGGGRCNVTHGIYEPTELTKNYPRGEKELRGPFHQFCSANTVKWFSEQGVALKTENDGRMFPESNSSQTIIDCFLDAAKKLKIAVLTAQSVQSIYKSEKNLTSFWKIDTQSENFIASKLILATGSNPKVWELIHSFGHAIVSPVPSLFTFNIKDARIKDLMGVSATVSVKAKDTKLAASGPLLITHWGMSGPAILKMSAWGARILFDKNYHFTIIINWLQDTSPADCEKNLKLAKQEHAKKTVSKNALFGLTTRLWEQLVLAAGIEIATKWAELGKLQLQNLSKQLTEGHFVVNGKSTFKEEFVTAGGVDLKEINFKTMESKLHQNLFFAGEVINIDAVTGGFNFQNAWTTGWLVAQNF